MNTAPHNATAQPAIPYTVRVQVAPLILIVLLGAGISIPLLTLLGRGPAAAAPVIVLLIAIWGALALLIFWIASYRVTLLPDRIRYRTLTTTHEAHYSDVAALTVETISVRGYRGERESRRLRVDARRPSETLLIPLAPFSRKGIATLVATVMSHAPHARIDASLRQFRTRFP